MELYHYPGKYKERNEGDRYAQILLESEQAGDRHCYANGDAMSLFPGGLTKLKEHPQQSQNIDYLIVRATHTFVAEKYRTGISSTGEHPITADMNSSQRSGHSARRSSRPSR